MQLIELWGGFFKMDALLKATKPSALARERHLVGK